MMCTLFAFETTMPFLSFSVQTCEKNIEALVHMNYLFKNSAGVRRVVWIESRAIAGGAVDCDWRRWGEKKKVLWGNKGTRSLFSMKFNDVASPRLNSNHLFCLFLFHVSNDDEW